LSGMSGERVNELHARWGVVSAIAGYYDKAKMSAVAAILLIERILPDLCGLRIERQDRVGIVAQNSV
jgi:hypothetical protein